MNVISSLSYVDTAGVLQKPSGLAFDSSGNLFVSDSSNNSLAVLPRSHVHLYGKDFSGNVLTSLSGLDVAHVLNRPQGIAFDSLGNLFVCSSTSLCVLPPVHSTIYGIDCSANVLSTLSIPSPMTSIRSLAIDLHDTLFLGSDVDTFLAVLPKTDISLYGVVFPANTISSLSALDPNSVLIGSSSLAFDVNGNLFIGSKRTPVVHTLDTPPPSPPAFPTFIFGYTYATTSTFLFHKHTITNASLGYRQYGSQGFFPPEHTPLQDTGRYVYIYGNTKRNRLKKYEFREVICTDTRGSGYICTWAASGISPTHL